MDESQATVLDEAIAWQVKLEAAGHSAGLAAACAAWRAADPSHEAAWHRVRAVDADFSRLANGAGRAARRTLEAAGHATGKRAAEGVERRRAVVKLLVLGGASAGLAAVADRQGPWRGWLAGVSADHATGIGERRHVDLPDGSRLQLNTASAVDLRWSAAQRLVVLRRGEIGISTAGDAVAAPPFCVDTAQGRLVARGARFFVRQDEARTRLRVTEGGVAMVPRERPAVPPRMAQTGDDFAMRADAVEPLVDDALDAGAWADGVLAVKRMRLADFVVELARYHPGWLRCDPAVAEWRVSGVFQLQGTEPALHALRAVARTLPIAVTQRARYWVELTAREPGPRG